MDSSFISNVHCFFEQSGVFKNAFRSLSVNAYDYDLKNDFGETDYQIDLFKEIENAYIGNSSIFDNILKTDLIFAFFPCVRFTHRNLINFQRLKVGKKNIDLDIRLQQNIRYFNEMNDLYCLITKLVIVCLRRDIRLIIENPYNERSILSIFWCIKPAVIHTDRRLFGDCFQKPTQYFFIGFEPRYNLIFEPLYFVESKTINSTLNTVERSLITRQYALMFIRTYIL